MSVINVIIVEDEALAAERLEMLLEQQNPDIKVLAQLDSVQEAVAYLAKSPELDLAFLDIQLADGSSFEIFDQVEMPCPVIFTTAYDAYALKAFEVNSIDYLLKPIDLDDLGDAFAKYERMKARFGGEQQEDGMEQIRRAMQMMQKQYKSRFVVKSGHQLSSIRVEDILYFFSEHKTVWFRQKNGKRHAVDYTLEQLEGLLDPNQFFRLNRKYVAHIDAIEKAVAYSNSRLKISLFGLEDDEIIVSRERTGAFKAWLDQ
ncbi:MAG: LytTR family DNA-binding domain-containing protein [Saprospiraceae bacterium]|nr:LytTR family DNA-binding domain-containing protein [Saprospiraceae bacterium]